MLIRVSTSPCVVLRHASRLQCSVASSCARTPGGDCPSSDTPRIPLRAPTARKGERAGYFTLTMPPKPCGTTTTFPDAASFESVSM
ncbi:MAG: hypothetical protein QOE37_904 [Microbacteriaceae bacterium]|jgi:hypothetical protein|nr:hypothetical protein [Microbacteriaceae bacterium]